MRRFNSEYCEICAKKKFSDTPDSTATFEGSDWKFVRTNSVDFQLSKRPSNLHGNERDQSHQKFLAHHNLMLVDQNS